MKVAIEGMDGSGKSTISKVVADKLNYDYVEKPLKNIFNCNDEEFENIFNLLVELGIIYERNKYWSRYSGYYYRCMARTYKKS